MPRILHVVGAMNRAGVETWLMQVLRRMERDRFPMHFLVHVNEPAAYDEEIQALGSRVIPCLRPSRPWLYARNFMRALEQHGPYDVIHSHVHHYSGWVLRLARRAGVPLRIAHSHLDTRLEDARAGPLRRVYLLLMRRWIRRHATCGLAASRQAAESLFGSSWRQDSRWRILHCGIDLVPFRTSPDRQAVREDLGLPAGAPVLGHVGRFEEQKNHAFLLQIAAELARREPRARWLLVGEGPLLARIEQDASSIGIRDKILFAGSRPDVPLLLCGGMDAFVFPSRYEGLGLALVEAQAAGLPCIVSDVVPEEADLVPPLVQRLSLAQPVADWAAAALAALRREPICRPHQALALMEQGPFDIATSVRNLAGHYLARSRR